MLLTIDHILTTEEIKQACSILAQAQFVAGKSTAGWHAQQVKQNTQLDRADPEHATLQKMVKAALLRHPLFQTAIQPASIHTVLFSRSREGMFYGRHVDNALMGKGDRRYRSDVSWTLFLSEPDTYAGGELVIEGCEGEQQFKLAAGSVILYPSTYLHEVAPVTSGERLVAVGWVQSLIRSADQREILFDLDAVRRSLFKQQGKTVEFDLISKTYSNLLRQWSEF